jgi:hypothetical protein
MNLADLAYLTQLLERHKIPATHITISHDDSISFNVEEKYNHRLRKISEGQELDLTISHDWHLFRAATPRYHLTYRRTV